MDGFKNSTKTRYFTRPNEGFGYAKGGEVVSRNDMPGGQGPMNAPALVGKYAKGGKVSLPKVTGPKGVAKVGKVMGEYKEGKLHSGSKKGPVVKNPKQAVAIALSEGRKASRMAMGGRTGYKEGGEIKKIARSMMESTSARPVPIGSPIRPPESLTFEERKAVVVPAKPYRGRAGDIPVRKRSDPESIMMRSDLDRALSTTPSRRGEMGRRSSMRDYIPDFMEPALERIGVLNRKHGGLAVMPKGKGKKR